MSGKNFQDRQGLLESQWAELCRRHLPVTERDSIWRYSRHELPDDPEQGWKLHLSATVLSAVRLFQTVAPLLSDRQVLFKAPRSLDELEKLNSGLYYGYSQVGKFITIYPQGIEEAVLLARELHQLTRRIESPVIPFDTPYREKSCVYYRYGAFKALEVDDSDGRRTSVLHGPNGKLIPDKRDSELTPEWVTDPFPSSRQRKTPPRPTPLQTTFKAFHALAQRGRGGVYQAVDLSVTPPRLCVIKQGRQHGEVSFDGRDGLWRVKHEKRVLRSLKRSGIPVPDVYSSFRDANNYFLVIEFIEGENLEQWLTRRRRRLPVPAALRRSAEVAQLVARIHASGWVWRDCKPRNIIVDKLGELRPLDFEGACPRDRPDPEPWGTRGYTPPEFDDPFRGQQRLPEDLYALGVITYILLAGCPPEHPSSVFTLEKIRKNVPKSVIQLLMELMDADPQRRPPAGEVAQRLEAELKQSNSRIQGVRFSRRANSPKRGSSRKELNTGSVVR